MTDLYDYLYQCGYYDDRDYALDFHKLSLPCYGATLGILAIDYRGYLYQCQHLLCREKFAIGNVFTGVPITKSLLHWYDGKISTSCEECEVLPLCQGGCVTKPRIGKNEYIGSSLASSFEASAAAFEGIASNANDVASQLESTNEALAAAIEGSF